MVPPAKSSERAIVRTMPLYDTVAIVGVGLLGGSIGLALRERGHALRIVGIGRNPSSLRAARGLGAVTHITTELRRGVKDADLIVVCTPVAHVVAHVLEVSTASRPEAVITDVGSTKAGIARGVRRAAGGRIRYVGSHPLTGSEKSGPSAARADLFEGRTVIVTPARGDPEADVAAVERFWRAVGGMVARMSPQRHDCLMAEASHVPHLVSAALAASTPKDVLEWTAGGWRDTTRVASGEPKLWTQIVAANRSNILKSWRRFERVLSSFRRAMETGNDRRLSQLLAKAKALRDAVGN